MPRVFMSRAVVGLAAVMMAGASGARAQGPGAAGGASGRSDGLAGLMRSMGTGPQTPVTVLMAPAVQQELKLTEAQKTKVFNLSVSATQKQREQFQSMLLGGGGNPQAMVAARNGLRRENEQAIAQMLDETQRGRFDQIVLQAEGPLAIARPEIASRLRLNDTQKEYVQSIMAELQKAQFVTVMRLRQAAATGQGNPGALRGMMESLRNEAVQRLGRVVDAKQKAAFNKMLGEPFDLAKLDAEADPNADPKPPGAPPAAESSSKPETEAKDAPAPDAATPKRPARPSRRPTRPRTKTSP